PARGALFPGRADVTDAKDRLLQIEQEALRVAKGARELLLNEGWDDSAGRHPKANFILWLLEQTGEMRISQMAKETGRSMKAVNNSIMLLTQMGKIERISRGLYRIVPREKRAPKAEMAPPK